MMKYLLLLVAALAVSSASEPLRPSCERPVYCDSKLLHHVMLQRIFPDSKTFVDLRLTQDPDTTLAEFDALLNETNDNPTKEQVTDFVSNHFANGSELHDWSPPDYNPDPIFLASIRDPTLRQFAKDINSIWPTLGRQVKQEVLDNPDRFSLIPVTHGFIIPGGRFKELYYWDTYWIIEGLLISGMDETVRGMIENLIEVLNKIGHVPNGSRWYYQERSQPPLLAAMMSIYIRHTGDIAFLKENMKHLETEIQYWLDTQRITFSVGDRAFTLLRYYAPSLGPRPESYYEDYKSAQVFTSEERKQEFYEDIKSAAESGWDFSTRWFVDNAGNLSSNLTEAHTRYIIPVDLNAIFANSLANAAHFEALLGNRFKANYYRKLAKQWRTDIEQALFHEKDGVWYDYDYVNKHHRRDFYPTNVAPLWMGAVDKDHVKKHATQVLEYLRLSHGLDYPGGVPASLIQSGEQWDFPNAWPPLVSMVVNAAEALDTDEGYQMAFEVAQTWVRACFIGYNSTKSMYEKYDAVVPGNYGGGGEYNVQSGFGWSNGVVLEFLAKYGQSMTVSDDPDDSKAAEPLSAKYKIHPYFAAAESIYNPSADDSNSKSCSTKSSQVTAMMARLLLPRVYPVLGLLGAYAHAIIVVPACNSSIYCRGDLLHRVQLARVFPDSKTFVDMKLVKTEQETLADFAAFMRNTNQNPSRAELTAFVNAHFLEGKELEDWNPPDFNPDPPMLNNIVDPQLRQFAKAVISIWARLGRKVNPDVLKNPDLYSFIPVPNGFIVPGGRFKELYYWDSFWILKGLIICNMLDTARAMVENLLHLVDTIGYVPNGSRIYYLGRSQPPLLAAMVSSYFSATRDVAWLKRHLPTVEKELEFWLSRKKVTVEVKGKKYMLLRYYNNPKSKGPRPESYYEDYTVAQKLKTEAERNLFYNEMKSGAESGWDFSSRWFVTAGKDVMGNLTDVHVSRILPVDLNAIFAGALQLVGDFRSKLNDRREALKWYGLAKYWRTAIEQVMWDESDGVWYDYDAQARALRKHFYPSCVTPLWAGAVENYDSPKYASRLVRYLMSSGAFDFPGGVPTSIIHSGEQWDYPNAWPPLQSIIILGLDMSGYEEAKKLAKELATHWIRANYIGYTTFQKMFEKYSAVQPGHQGGGGEYMVQDGFGWTNGVVLELLQRYGNDVHLDAQPKSIPFVEQIV
ncbi:uncharacterized protein LOC126369097 [Pectinophora gossypiella]|uniref:uncharacterized protein LOC126369097 n=1 Tax=Pectinophora gossypiella TaxID=13191 RepID=UPI00214EE4BC|nr:uncharacterized protein LOC126369097 [Pectinophora gossypiella]